jgi:hypothetical protein
MKYESSPIASMVSWYTLAHSVLLVDPSYFLMVDGLRFGGQMTFLKSRENGLITPVSQPLISE